MLYERSKRPAPFAEEQNAKLQSELRENHTKIVSVENSERRCSIKKARLKNFAIFIGKDLDWSLFLTQLQSATLLKRHSNTGVFLRILQTAASACLRLTLFNQE